MTERKLNNEQGEYWAYFAPDGNIQVRSIAETKSLSREMICAREYNISNEKVTYKAEPTYFVEKITRSLLEQGNRPVDINCDFNEEMYYIVEGKHHTIRAGNRWKVGDKFSPRVWSGKPYASKQIEIAPAIEIKKIWKYEIKVPSKGVEQWLLNDTMVSESNEYMQQWFNAGLIEAIAKNDGLTLSDFLNWFQHPKPFIGQIIAWNESINY